MTDTEILEQAKAAGAKYLYTVDKNVMIGTLETVPPTAVPQNVICMGTQQFTEFVQEMIDAAETQQKRQPIEVPNELKAELVNNMLLGWFGPPAVVFTDDQSPFNINRVRNFGVVLMNNLIAKLNALSDPSRREGALQNTLDRDKARVLQQQNAWNQLYGIHTISYAKEEPNE